MKKTYIINGEPQTHHEFHFFGLTVLVYRKCKHCEKRIRIDRDYYFGTGTTVLFFLPF